MTFLRDPCRCAIRARKRPAVSDPSNDKRVLAVLGVAVIAAGGWWLWQMGSAEPPAATTTQVSVSAHALQSSAFRGLSDLTARPGGALVAVPERQRALVFLAGQPLDAARQEPLQGLDGEIDVESVAFLDRGRAVLGTELHRGPRDDDALYLASEVTSAAGTHWAVTPAHKLPYKLWNLQASDNHGIEGLCALPGGVTVVAAVEQVEAHGNERRAPLGVLDWPSGRWTPYWLRLTSGDGKPSALWCAPHKDGGIALWLVERHYGTSRIVTAHLPAGLAAGATLELKVWLDLAPNLTFLPNWEGLVVVDDQTVQLLSDNASGAVQRGPSYFLQLHKP